MTQTIRAHSPHIDAHDFSASGAVLAGDLVGVLRLRVPDLSHSSVQQLQTLSRAIASNSTAALAFENADDATSVLAAFKADPHIVAAALYDNRRESFRHLSPRASTGDRLPARTGGGLYASAAPRSIGFQPVAEGAKQARDAVRRIGPRAPCTRACGCTALIVVLVAALSLPLAYLISRRLQHRLLQPDSGAGGHHPRGVGAARLHRARRAARAPTSSTCSPTPSIRC